MKEIPLTKGYRALVDDADFEALSAHHWIANAVTKQTREGPKRRVYVRSGNKSGRIYMHKLLMGFSPVDHIDGNGLNNQRHNLRPATFSQNGANSPSRKGTSKFKGVHWDKVRSKWFACIQKDHKTIALGRFKDEVDAAQAYNFAAYELFGEFARMNTPLAGYESRFSSNFINA